MANYIQKSGLKVDENIYNLFEREILPLLKDKFDSEYFWNGLSDLFSKFVSKNKKILKKRDEFQAQLNHWYQKNPGKIKDKNDYKQFLKEIGYLFDEPQDVTIKTQNIDEEITQQCGPQLVVPAMNARYSLNAANARWGSLYDALYGTNLIDVEGDLAPGSSYNPKRGKEVILFAKNFLDKFFPLNKGSHNDAVNYIIHNRQLKINLKNNETTQLVNNDQFVAYKGEGQSLQEIVLVHNGLHVMIKIDKTHHIGSSDSAGIKDIFLESAITTIIDLEDSMAAVDGEDKTLAYKNIFGLQNGKLTADFERKGKKLTRHLNSDLEFKNAKDDAVIKYHGTSLLFFRSVGFLMTTPAILDAENNELPENILDDVTIALTSHFNNRKKSVYIVKPKMHGPEEVALVGEIFSAIESLVKIPNKTLKIGIMDEERRTSINLKACIKAAEERVVFINTGFLDRTGDEIHTSLYAGVFVPKSEMKTQKWFNAYELNNVEKGLECGFLGRAQIGKGMWTMTDLLADMYRQKIEQPKAGATTAWVPSPTAATIHALHYHEIDVLKVQKELFKKNNVDYLNDILEVPVVENPQWTDELIQKELDNNCQSILGYVVRWVEHGIGCSKVPDINNVALMEDRATLRISSQSLANWLLHGIITAEQVEDSLRKMAIVVDKQNASDINYVKMEGRFDSSPAFLAARDLIIKGIEQPSGYTEPLLHSWRRKAKNFNNILS